MKKSFLIFLTALVIPMFAGCSKSNLKTSSSQLNLSAGKNVILRAKHYRI